MAIARGNPSTACILPASAYATSRHALGPCVFVPTAVPTRTAASRSAALTWQKDLLPPSLHRISKPQQYHHRHRQSRLSPTATPTSSSRSRATGGGADSHIDDGLPVSTFLQPVIGPPWQVPSLENADAASDPCKDGAEASHLAVLRRVAGGTVLRVAEGPMGRGLFTTAPVLADAVLLSLPDVNLLIVPDPDNDPAMQLQPDHPMPPRISYSALHHQQYLTRWQRHHGIDLPPALTEVLSASSCLPAPARLALWLIWLRRRSGVGGDDGVMGTTTGSDDTCRHDQGLGFWRSYFEAMPPAQEITCLSVLTEQEAGLIQVPGYLQQWSRIRGNVTNLLGVANQVAEVDEAQQSVATSASAIAHATDYNGRQHSCYSLEELCYCYGLATSRCFHLPGRMALVPYADMGNHQPLWQASAYPWWEPNGPTPGESASAVGRRESLAIAVATENAEATAGRFEYRASRKLPAGAEVCTCYLEGGNEEQLFTYGFVRQANPYDRLDLHLPAVLSPPHAARTNEGSDGHGGYCSQGGAGPTRDVNGQTAAGGRLCWPALVAAAGFWAPQQARAGDSDEGDATEEALEQSHLRPRPGDLPGGAWDLQRWRWPRRSADGGDESVGQRRLQLQRRRAALLSLPHTAADTAALRREGLGWAASPQEELRRWARGQAAAAAAAASTTLSTDRGADTAAVWRPVRGLMPADALADERSVLASQLQLVEELQRVVRECAAEMATALDYDEALWRAVQRRRGQSAKTVTPVVNAAAEARDAAADGASGEVGGGVWGWLQTLKNLSSVGERSGATKGLEVLLDPLVTNAAAMCEEAEVEKQQQNEAVSGPEGFSPHILSMYDTPRGRTALLARLEYKRVLAQAGDVLQAYGRVVRDVMR